MPTFGIDALSPWFAAAGSIPIIIHLLNRQQYRRVKWAAMEKWKGSPIVGPVDIEAHFYFSRPKSHSTKKGARANAPFWKESKPDIDKLLRAVLYALTHVIYTDDSQVCVVRASKNYVTENVGVNIRVERMA